MLRRKPRSASGPVELRLRELRAGAARVDVHGPAGLRTVSVLTDGRVPLFPHPLTDAGESTGDDELDAAVRAFVQRQLAERSRVNPRWRR